MTIKEVRKKAIEKYCSHKLNSWILGFTCGLFSSAIVALNFIFPYLSILLVPGVVFPFIFACYLSQESYNDGVDLTLGNFFKFFLLYYRAPFNTSFNTVRSFFKSLLIFIGTSLIGGFIAFEIYKYQNGQTFIDLFSSLYDESIKVEIDLDAYRAILDANDGLLLNFFMSYLTPSFLISIFVFVFLIGKESVNIFLRVALPRSNPFFLHQTSKIATRRHFKEFYGTFIGLNWPFFLLIIIGLIGGSCLITFTSFEPFRAITMGAVFAFGLSSFFYPFFFCNNAALYECFEEKYKTSSKEVVEEMIKRIEEVTEVSPRMKDKFQNTMTNIGDPLTDNNEEESENDKNATNPDDESNER